MVKVEKNKVVSSHRTLPIRLRVTEHSSVVYEVLLYSIANTPIVTFNKVFVAHTKKVEDLKEYYL